MRAGWSGGRGYVAPQARYASSRSSALLPVPFPLRGRGEGAARQLRSLLGPSSSSYFSLLEGGLICSSSWRQGAPGRARFWLAAMGRMGPASSRPFVGRLYATTTASSAGGGLDAQDFSEDEAREAAARQQRLVKKAAAPPPSPAVIRRRRMEELLLAANDHISQEKWILAEDSLNTILDLAAAPEKKDGKEGQDQKQRQAEDESFMGRVLVNLAFVEQNVGKRDKAERHYADGLAILRRTLGDEHHEVARGLLNYAEVLAFLSKLEQAETISKQAIPLFEKNYGQQSELVGALLSNLGGYLCAQKKFEEAEPVLARALDILDKSLGRNNEYTSACLTNYANLLRDMELPDKLLALQKKYSTEEDTFLALDRLDKGESDPVVKDMMDQFRTMAESGPLNPEGFFKPDLLHKEEIKEFIKLWEQKNQGKLDPTLIPTILEEIEAVPQEDLDKLLHDVMRQQTQDTTLDSVDKIANQIDESAENDEDGDDDDDDDEDSDTDDDGDDEILLEEDQKDELMKKIEQYEQAEDQNTEIDMTHVKLE